MAKEQLAGSKELRIDLFEMNSGVYFLYDDDELVYIGQAYNVSRRIIEHILEGVKKFNRVRYNLVPADSLNEVEFTLIRALRPKYNNTCQGTGDYNKKPTMNGGVTYRAVALRHWERAKTGAMPVRIRFCYHRRYFYFPTNLTAYPEDVDRGTVINKEILKDLEPLMKRCKDAVKYVTRDKSFEFVKNKVMALA